MDTFFENIDFQEIRFFDSKISYYWKKYTSYIKDAQSESVNEQWDQKDIPPFNHTLA